MENTEGKGGDDQRYETRSFGKYGSIAFQMIAVIGVFTYLGYRIDKTTGHDKQWVTAIFALVGVVISMYLIFKSLKA